MSKPHVLLVSCNKPGHVLHRYRAQHIAETLEEMGWVADTAFVGDSRIRVAHDVVVLHRICSVWEGRQFARAARSVGAALVYSSDDLIWDEAHLNHPGMEKMREFAPRHRDMMRTSDALMLSTAFLAENAAAHAPEVPRHVVRYFLGREYQQVADEARTAALQSRAERARHGEFVIGYFSGTATHDADLATIADPLVSFLRARPAARLLLVGPVALPAALEPVRPQVTQRGLLPWRDVPHAIAETDVNISPLVLERAFNQGKTVIKFLEAAAVEVPTIAAANSEYRRLRADEECFVCETPQDWAEALRRAADDIPHRHAVAARAREHALTTGSADAHRAPLAAQFESFLRLKRPDAPLGRSRRVNWPFAPKYAVKRVLGGILKR